MTDPTGHTASPTRRAGMMRGLWPLALIAILAIALRVYRLADQSAWVDEFFNLTYHEAPSLGHFLTFVRLFGLDITPLGFALLYLWGQVVGNSSLVFLRLGPVLVGAACVPFVYGLGLRMAGRRAALIAALLVAISPAHIWISQAIRPNPLIELGALLSLASLYWADISGRRAAWVLNGAANLALMWMHPFCGLLIGAEGLYLLWSFRKSLRHVIVWGAIHLVIAVSPLTWMYTTLSYVASAQDDFVMQLPSLGVVISDWLGDDAVQTSDPFAFQGDTWPFLQGRLREGFAASHTWWDAILMAFYGACAGFLLWRLLRRSSTPADRKCALLLLAISTAPVLLEVAISWVWRPIVLPRYTSYTSFGFYIAAGWFLASMDRTTRWTVLPIVLALYAYQLSFVLPASTRTNWLGAGQALEEMATPEDLVLVDGTHFALQNFRLNLGHHDIGRMEPAYSYQSICDKAAAYLNTPQNKDRSVWVTVEPFVYNPPPCSGLEASLRDLGLRFDMTYFPGMNGVFLYRVQADPDSAPVANPQQPPSHTDYTELAQALDLDPADPGVMEALRRALDCDWPLTRFYLSLLAVQLVDNGEAELAAAAARAAIEKDPAYPLGPFALAVALYESGDLPEARAAYAEAVRVDKIGYFKHYEGLFTCLYEKRDLAAAREHFDTIDSWGLYLPFAIRKRFQ